MIARNRAWPLLLLLLTLCACSGNAAIEEPSFTPIQTASPSPSPEISPAPTPPSAFSLSLGDQVVSLKDRESKIDLASLLGPPVSEETKDLQGDGFTGSKVKTVRYPGLEIEMFAPPGETPQYWLMTMTVTSDAYRTPAGVQIGDRLSDLQAVYPDIQLALDGRTDPMNGAYQIADDRQYNYVQFEVADGILTQIRIFHLIP
ncbi:hypothetical protein [Cohnella sp. REN36]|uniref:hypothetical protein n=1 Tax=Cohnella sp. REN36 TaxID=2887347 RepID=UPI001D138025|nr:hypothetical protein [Cohnella sp. REN36]MCC3374531.1 hypothetical protein [Cohnella sp. REN36]